MKKTVVLLFAIGGLALSLAAQQPNQYTAASDSDPEAKAILDKLRKKYDAYGSMEVDFTLEIQFPEQPKEVQQGKVAVKGKQYRVDLGSQTVISDGTAVWMVLHNNKEVQINDVPEEEETGMFLSPQSFFRFYDKGDFIYVLSNEFAQNGKIIQLIEFKPTDAYADYSKLRMNVDRNKNEVDEVMAFGKDGSRYTFKINRLTPNKAFPASTFTFDKAQYPGYYIEDLRE